MIIYFVDRGMRVIGQASTELPQGLIITDDSKVESVETGVDTFSAEINYDDESRALVESCATAGNYVLRYSDGKGELYEIVEAERDTDGMNVSIYAEDDGLEMLNNIAFAWPDDNSSIDTTPKSISEYFAIWLEGTGFSVAYNEMSDDVKKAPPDGGWREETVVARLQSIAEMFECEIDFTYDVSGLKVVKKYVNIYKKRGKNVQQELRLNRDVDSITVKTSIGNLATALYVYGDKVGDKVQTLDGYSYDDGDYHTVSHYFPDRRENGVILESRDSLARWGTYVNGSYKNLIRPFKAEGTDKASMCQQAVAELDKIGDMEVNYECRILRLPSYVSIGDRVNIVDEKGELYLSARLLELDTSVTDGTRVATLGEYLLRSSGISDTVRRLASEFAQIAERGPSYTWIAYADDDVGTGISLSPVGKSFMGIIVNMYTSVVDISDPSIFTWVELEAGEAVAIGLKITSSAGNVFIETTVATTLTAHVYLNGEELTETQIEDIGTIRWYDYDNPSVVLHEGITYELTEQMGINAISITARLEIDDE